MKQQKEYRKDAKIIIFNQRKARNISSMHDKIEKSACSYAPSFSPSSVNKSTPASAAEMTTSCNGWE